MPDSDKGVEHEAVKSLRTLADRLHDASDTERACATGAQFARGLADDLDAALAASDQEEWTCNHGVTYSGSDDFISGARNAHLELEEAVRVRPEDGRSLNDIAHDILAKAPEVEELVEEWFEVTGRADMRRWNQAAREVRRPLINTEKALTASDQRVKELERELRKAKSERNDAHAFIEHRGLWGKFSYCLLHPSTLRGSSK